MEIWIIAGIAVLTVVSSILLKQLKPEFSMFVVVIGSIIIISLIIDYCDDIFSILQSLVDKTGLSSGVFSVIIKIIGIGYLAEFTSSICNDAGCSAIGDKVIFAAKIIILFLSLPILTSVIDIIVELL